VIVLAIDTTQGACSAAVMDGCVILASLSEPMQRGHQERLAPLVAETMTAAGLGFGELDRIGVTVGPGSFTGLRVGLAFAKGLALALDIPCVGIGALEALAASDPGQELTAAVIDAGRGQIYLQLFDAGVARGAPEVAAFDDAPQRIRRLAGDGPLTLLGSAAALAERMPGARFVLLTAPDPVAIARLAAAAPAPAAPPQPLYLRAPDARLPA